MATFTVICSQAVRICRAGSIRIVVAFAVIALAALSVLIYCMLQPMLQRAHELGVHNKCRTRLSAIGNAVEMYKDRHGYLAPPSLQELVKQGMLEANALRCPAVRIHRECDYIYVPPAKTARPGTLMACDYGSNHGQQGRAVLVAGLSIKFMSPEQFEAEIERKENSEFAAVVKAMEAENSAAASGER